MIAQKTDTTAPSARKSHIGIVYSILMVLLLLVLFLLSPANKVYASVVLTAVLVIATGLFGREELDETKMSLPMILCFFGLAGSILLTMAISPYSMRDLFIDTSFLLLTVLFFYCIRPSSFEISPFMKRVFYCLALAVVLVSVFRRDAETPYYVFGSYDKNYFGVVLFLFFCWCWYEKRKLGVAVCVVAALVLNSRGYQMMLLCFALINAVIWIRARRKGSVSQPSRSVHPVVLFLLFALMFFSIVTFSWWWSTAVVGGDTVSASLASRGLNDTSNAIRFNSNLYAIEQISKDPLLIFRGYDIDIRRVMNIGNPFGDKDTLLASASLHGYRVVQPHHAVINLLLKHGVLYTIFYFAVFSIVIAPYARKETAGVWVPFFLVGMVMHSTMTSHYLLFFVFVLATSAHDQGFCCADASRAAKKLEKSPNQRVVRRRVVSRKGAFI